MNFRTVGQMSACIARNLDKLPRDIDVIVGVPRSGSLAANLLALHMNLPLTDVQGLLEGKLMDGGSRLRGRIPNDGAARERGGDVGHGYHQRFLARRFFGGMIDLLAGQRGSARRVYAQDYSGNLRMPQCLGESEIHQGRCYAAMLLERIEVA